MRFFGWWDLLLGLQPNGIQLSESFSLSLRGGRLTSTNFYHTHGHTQALRLTYLQPQSIVFFVCLRCFPDVLSQDAEFN